MASQNKEQHRPQGEIGVAINATTIKSQRHQHQRTGTQTIPDCVGLLDAPRRRTSRYFRFQTLLNQPNFGDRPFVELTFRPLCSLLQSQIQLNQGSRETSFPRRSTSRNPAQPTNGGCNVWRVSCSSPETRRSCAGRAEWPKQRRSINRLVDWLDYSSGRIRRSDGRGWVQHLPSQ